MENDIMTNLKRALAMKKMRMYTFNTKSNKRVGMFLRLLCVCVLISVSFLYSYETPEMYVKKVLKHLKKEKRDQSLMVKTIVRVLDPQYKKDSADIEVMSSDSTSHKILKMTQIQESGSGLVETTNREFYFTGDTLYFISVTQKLENTFVKTEPFYTERRVFVKGNQIVKTMFKQGTEKNYKREDFYEQQKGTQSWKEAQALFDLAVDIHNQLKK